MASGRRDRRGNCRPSQFKIAAGGVGNILINLRAMDNTLDQLKEWTRRSVTLKLLVVGFLILVLLIPAAMIRSMVHERRERRNAAMAEISASWASRQTLRGPLLRVPVRRNVRQS